MNAKILLLPCPMQTPDSSNHSHTTTTIFSRNSNFWISATSAIFRGVGWLIFDHTRMTRFILSDKCHKKNGNGYFVECGKLSGVICRKFDADFFGGMKGKVRNETMQNVAEMNIY